VNALDNSASTAGRQVRPEKGEEWGGTVKEREGRKTGPSWFLLRVVWDWQGEREMVEGGIGKA